MSIEERELRSRLAEMAALASPPSFTGDELAQKACGGSGGGAGGPDSAAWCRWRWWQRRSRSRWTRGPERHPVLGRRGRDSVRTGTFVRGDCERRDAGEIGHRGLGAPVHHCPWPPGHDRDQSDRKSCLSGHQVKALSLGIVNGVAERGASESASRGQRAGAARAGRAPVRPALERPGRTAPKDHQAAFREVGLLGKRPRGRSGIRRCRLRGGAAARRHLRPSGGSTAPGRGAALRGEL